MDSLEALKKKIAEKTGVPVGDQQPLYFNGAELTDDNGSLLEYDILPDGCPGGPIVTMGSTAWDPFYLKVKLPSGRTYKAYVTMTTTVGQLKGAITTDCGIPYLVQKLYLDEMQLQDRFTLADYVVPADAKVDLVLSRPIYAGPAVRPTTN